MLFFELIQVALDNQEVLSHSPSDKEWHTLFNMCQKQAVTGIGFVALEKLSKKGQKPPVDLLFEWIGISEQIKLRNKLLNQRCIEALEILARAGFEGCILKGQGNSVLYSHPYARTPGDVDIWVPNKTDAIKTYVRDKYPDAEDCVYHIDYPVFDDVEVEVHYTPSWIGSPKYQKKITNYYLSHEIVKRQKVKLPDSDDYIYVPSIRFNIVYQIVHIMSHFINYGVGLRQIMDYYYLLLNNEEEINRENWSRLFKELGLYKVAGAVMWVLRNKLLLDEKYILINPDRTRGKLLLEEIMICGNMGKYDNRLSGRTQQRHPFISKFIRGMKLGFYFPYEVWASPILRNLRITFC